MASAAPREDVSDITKCSICLEEFKTPKYLPCLHTFCEACLNSFITSAFQKSAINKPSTGLTFSCPVCRDETKPVDSSVPYQDWATQFPLNHLMVTLIDQNKLKAKMKLCDPCQFAGNEVKAVSWCTECNEALCETCLTTHQRLRMSRNHILQNVDEIQNTMLITSLETCTNHKGKTIDAFCVDHDLPCCTTCIAIHHRKCDQVTTLEEASHGALESQSFTELLESLLDGNKISDDLMKEKLQNLEELERKKSAIQKEVHDVRQAINKQLDLMESKFMEDMTSLHKQRTFEISEGISKLENSQKVIKNCKSLMDTCKTQASETRTFLEMKKIEKKAKEQLDVLHQLTNEHKLLDYEFKRDAEAEKVTRDLKRFGEITVNENSSLTISPYKNLPLKDCIPRKVASYSLRDKCGKDRSYIYGGMFLPDGTILLALYPKKMVVKIREDGNLLSKCDILPGYGFDITLIDTNKVAVTGYDSFEIYIIDTHSLKLTKTLSIEDRCYGVVFDDHKLYVGCSSKILILDKDGGKLHEMNTVSGVKTITIVKPQGKMIVFTNLSSNSCYFIRERDLKEMHVFTHTELRGPFCVTSDRDSNVYICGRESGNVLQLSADGILIKILLTGLDCPTAMRFDGDWNRFLLCNSGEPFVSIYEMIKP